MSKTIAFNGMGLPLGEILAAPQRAWLLNDAGQGSFNLDIDYARKIQDRLLPGTLILIQDEKLPDWAGFIDTPETWGTGVVTFSLYSIERILGDGWRIGDGKKRKAISGSIFKKMIDLANAPEDLMIRYGDIFMGGTEREETVGKVPLMGEIQRVSDRTGYDWNITPVLDGNNHLSFLANWYQVMGISRQDYILDGINTKTGSTPLRRVGTIVNSVLGMGQPPAAGGDAPSYRYEDTTSRGFYRLRQGAQTFDGNVNQATLEANTKAFVAKNAYPRLSLDLTALDIDNLFAKLKVGDVARTINPNIGMRGIDTFARITGLQYTETTKEVDITVEEVISQ
jgi:hypothetical protein